MASSTQVRERSTFRLTEAAAVITAAVSVAAVLGLGRETLLAVALPALASSVFVLVAGRRALAVRTIPVFIALGGSTGVGKTVFANVVASRLSEGNSSLLSFVPETLTAQHVYRTISGLRRGTWPPRTGTDSIDRFRGTVELQNQRPIRRLIQGHIEFELEIGDSAGELWDEVGDSDPENPSRLIDSPFFEYVGESTGLFYLIDSQTIRERPAAVSEHVDDLLSTLQVLRSIEGRGGHRLSKPIALLISKADLLTPDQIDAIRVALGDGFGRSPQPDRFDKPFVDSLRRLEHLGAVMDRQVSAFQAFVVSSIQDAQLNDRRGLPPEEFFDEVEAPDEWVIRDVIASGR